MFGLHAGWAAWLAGHPRAFLAGIAGASLLMALWYFNPRMEHWDDNAEFIILARSIVQGRWMQLINQPDSPRSDKFPFGFPLLLAGIEWLAPGNLLAMKAFVLALYVLAMPVAYLLLRRYLPALPALAATTLTLLNPLLLSFSYQVMSEVPYLLASLLALLCLERAEEPAEAGRVRALVAGALLAVAATTIRPVGPALFGGAVLWYLVRREYRRGLLVAGIYLGVLLTLHVLGARVFGPFYVQEAMKVDPKLPELGEMGPAKIPERILGNLEAYGLALIPRALVAAAKPPLLNLLVAGICLVGAIRVPSGRMLPFFFLLAYGGFLALWPSSIPQRRYLMPIIPLLLLCFLNGLSTALRFILQWPKRLQAYRASLGAGLFFITAGIMIILYSLTLYRTRAEYNLVYQLGWKSYFEAAAWLKDHSPPDAVVVTRKPFQVHLISQRKTVGFLLSPDPEAVIEDMRRYRATFVVLDSVKLGMRKYLISVINAHREQFELVYSTPTASRPAYIFRVKDWIISSS